MKRNHGVDRAAELCRRLVVAHGADGFIAGCTEFHLVTKQLSRAHDARWIDPLTLVARRLPALLGR